MALSRNEFFKNILVKIVQNTGLVNDVTNKEQMKAFVRAAKIDAAVNVSNWNNIVYPIFRTLRSAPEHEYDVLDSQWGGLSGWTITTEPWATPEGMECLWDFTRGQPHSITGTIMCLASQIENIQQSEVNVDTYDDSELRSLIECIDLNMGQLKQDLLADCYFFDCDGNGNLQYSLARHISEIMSQLIVGAPSTGLEGCFDDAYPTLSLEIRVSQFIYDALIPASKIEYCGTGNLLSDALQKIHDYVGQSSCLDDAPQYSTQAPTGPSAGNNLVADGDNLTAAIKQIDRDLHSNKNVDLTADTGSVSGTTTVSATTPNDTLTIVAGDHIALEGASKQVKVSVSALAIDDLSDVSAAAPNDDDILRYDTATSQWVTEPLPASGGGSGNVSIWLRPVDFDQRSDTSGQTPLVTERDLTADLDIFGNPIVTENNNGTSDGHTETLHNRNMVRRKTFEYEAGPSGAGIATDRWYAHNVVPFTFQTGMSEDDQLSFATFAMPRISDGVGGWVYPTNMKVTGFFYTQAEAPPAWNWVTFPNNRFNFSLTSHQDPSGAAGSIIPFVDGLQMTDINFNAVSDPSGYSVAQSNHVDKDYRVCVLDFPALSINNQPDMNGFLTLRLSPVNGLGAFDYNEPVAVYLLGLRVDFVL